MTADETAQTQSGGETAPNALLDAALQVFHERGFNGARMDDIAERAGVSKGALYLRFASKKAMLEALVKQSAGRVAETINEMVACTSPRDPEATLRLVLQMLLTAVSDPVISAAPRIIFAEAARFPELARFYRERVIDVGLCALESMLVDGAAAGVWRPVGHAAAVRAIAGPVYGHMMLAHALAVPGSEPEDPSQIAAEIADILLYGLNPR